MALKFIQDPYGPEGMGRAVDEEAGLDRVVYDPDLARRLTSGQAPTDEQKDVIENAAPAPTQAPAESTPATSPNFETQLSPQEETAYQAWKAKNAPQDSGGDYDLRGAFKAGVTPDPQNGHWPDTYKKPNHPTFSDQSQYAAQAPDRAGTWQGDTYVPPQNLAQRLRSKFGDPDAGQVDPADPAATQRYAPQDLLRARPQPPPAAPTAPAGTLLQKATITPGTPGTPYDQQAAEERADLRNQRKLELQLRADKVAQTYEAMDLLKQQKEAQDRKELAETQAKQARYEKQYEDVVKREIDPERLKKSQGVWGSILGMIGAFNASVRHQNAYTGQNAINDFRAAMDRRIQRDVEAQKEEKESTINRLTKLLGSQEQAVAHYKAGIYAMGVDRLKDSLGKQGLIDQYSDGIAKIEQDGMSYEAAARAASFGKPGELKAEYERPKPTGPGKIGLNNPTTKQLEGLGITTEAWTKGLNGKVSAGENSPTIAQAAVAAKQIDADLSLLESLAAANGGTIPTTGVIRIPKTMIPFMSRLGWKEGQNAEEANRIIQTYLTKTAKQYGGVITVSDIERAMEESGSSTQGKLTAMRNMRDQTNNGIRTALSQQFPGVGQPAFDILLSDSAANTGVPTSKTTPFERQNGDGDETTVKPRVVAKDPKTGQEFYEAPEAKRKREAREARERGAKARPVGDREKIEKVFGF